MESERLLLRVASFRDTITVDSEKPRIPISAARAVAAATAADAFLLSRSLSGSFSSAGSFPIRAPITVDDDDDSGTDGDNLASSEASNYSRGLDSGTDDGFESVSGDEDVILGGVRVLGEELGGGIGDGSDFSGGSVVYRPFAGDVDEETSVNYSSVEEESENSDEVGGSSEGEVSDADGVSVRAKVVIPRAMVSLDDDEFDEIFSSDEEVALVRVITAPGDEENEIGDTGMVDEPECSGSGIGELVSTEKEVVKMNYSDKLEDGLISDGITEELSLSVSPRDYNGGNSVEASMGLRQSFKQHIEKEVVQKGIIMDDDGGSIHEDDSLMKPVDVEGVEDSAVESGEMGMTDKSECSGSVTGELISAVEDMQVNDGLLSFETIEGNSLGSDDEEATLARVIKAPGNEESKAEERGLQLGDMGMVEEQECSGSGIAEFVSTEEEELKMNCSDKVDDGFNFLGNIEELNPGVPPVVHNDSMMESEGNSVKTSMGSGGSFKQLIEKEVVQRIVINVGDDSSIHEDNSLMKPGDDVEGVEDSTLELGEMGMKPECSGFVTGELVFTKKDGSLATIKETNQGASPGNCNEFLVESEGKAVGERGLDETFSQLVEQGVDEASISKENNNRKASSCDTDKSMIPVEEPIGLGKRESGVEDSGNLKVKAQEWCENDHGPIMELETPECEKEHEVGTIYESFQLTPTLNSVTTRNLEFSRAIDVLVSGYGSSDQEYENEGKQESETANIDRKLSLPSEDSDRNLSHADDDGSINLKSSFETANETVEGGGQISEQINKQINLQSDSELNQNSLGIEETSLCSVEDAVRTLPDNPSVTAYDPMENETQMARLIHNHTFMELDENKGTSDTKEQVSESTFHNYFEELSPDRSLRLISEKVKERVEKTRLLKEKLKMITGGGLCSENSAVTEVVSKPTLAGGDHQTSLGLNNVPDGTKIVLRDQKFPENLDFSINVLVIGKTGVGKSATVNSIFGETKSPVGAFEVTTKSANYVVGNVGGVLVRILDTPGLMSSAAEESLNEEVLVLIKKKMRIFPVDVVLYIDRLDENPDIHLLRIITNSLGSSIWQNAIVVLTHAASDVSDSLSYKDYIAQRSTFMHQSIRQAVPELSCVEESKMPEVLLAENNMSSFCGSKTSESTCPDWRLNLLILCCSVKIQSKADSLRKNNILVEKPNVFGSSLQSLALFCSLWNLGANPGHTTHLHKDLEETKQQILDSNSEIFWDKQSGEEKEMLPVKNQEPEYEERKATVLGSAKTRRGRLGFQATKRFGIYLDTSELHTGFSVGDYRKHEEGEGRILMRTRGSLAILGLVPTLMSVFNSVYGRKTAGKF